jgi:ubiquinone/menaquinone biosynthesis C-methylase UbiE
MAQPQAQVSYQSSYYDDHYEEQAASIREQRVQPLLCAFYDGFAERVLDVTGAAALGRPVRVFEAGCGEGLVAAALRRVADRRGIELEYTGCDLSGVGLDLLAETVPGTFLPGDAVQVAASLPEASADVVVAKNLLHHIDDPDAFLVQAARVAGPAGHVLVLEARLAQPLNLLASLPFYEREKLFFQGARRNRRAIDAAGLEVVHSEPFNWFPFELACATRLQAPRRALARVRSRRALDRIVRLDGALTRLMPWFAQYTLWQLATPSRHTHATPTDAEVSAQRAWQQDHYDMHYPRHAPHVREQLVHPLFRSFNDRLAGLVLGLGAEHGGGLDVFEAGCGEGLLATSLQGVAAEQGRELRYTASDLSPAGLELAAETVAGTFVAGDATEVAAGLPDDSFDVVIAKNLLHHIDDPAAFLREARRIVRPTGRIVIVEARLGYAPTFLACLLIPHQERYFFQGRRRNVRAADAAGLDLLAIRRFGWFPYELAFSTRFRTVRRAFRLRRPATIERFWAADERLASAMPWFTAYELWALAPGDAAALAPEGVSSV